jgi:predicted transposase/invertase (TIGR01784 family)
VPVNRNNPEKITGVNTEDATADEGTVYFDIRFVALLPGTNENVRIIVNVETQNKYNPGYSLVKRGLYYCCRLISAQNETEFSKNDYDNIRKVYSIWICTDAPNYAKNTINRYCIKEENMVGEYKIDSSKYDLINMILLCLDKDSEEAGNKEIENKDIEPEKVENEKSEILRLLRIVLSEYISTDKRKNILNNDFDIDDKYDLGEEMNCMCNLGEGIRERAMSAGIEKGIEKGISTGKELTQLENIKNLMKNLKITFEEAATALGLSDADKERLAAKI